MSRPPKSSISELDRLFSALADPTRREIMVALREAGELTAGEIGDRFPAISRPAVSKHLRVLRAAALIEETRSGRHVIYRLSATPVSERAESWLEPFRRAWQGKLDDLKRFVETGERATPDDPCDSPDIDGRP